MIFLVYHTFPLDLCKKPPTSTLDEGGFDSFISLKTTQTLFDVDANL